MGQDEGKGASGGAGGVLGQPRHQSDTGNRLKAKRETEAAAYQAAISQKELPLPAASEGSATHLHLRNCKDLSEKLLLVTQPVPSPPLKQSACR